jgi:hypothetical protein
MWALLIAFWQPQGEPQQPSTRGQCTMQSLSAVQA